MTEPKLPAGAPLAGTVRPEASRHASRPPPSAGEMRAGRTVGRFFLLNQVNSGWLGAVWSAYDPQLDRRVALKFARNEAGGSAQTLARLRAEAQALARVSHPNVIALHDVGADADQVYIAEELVGGMDLAQWLRTKPRAIREIMDVYQQAGRGLAAAHAAGIVHRDFQPASALIGPDGRVRVADFGLARTISEAAPPSGPESELGTPRYMAPEQRLGRPSDARSDQFSFCFSLYEALYAEAPFAGQSQAELDEEARRGNVRAAPKGTRVPSRLREVVLRGLRPDPEERWASMDTLLASLARNPRAVWRKLAMPAAVALGVAAAMAFGAHLLQQRRELCKSAERKLTGIWDGPRKAAARAAFAATGVPYAPNAWTSAEKGLDAYGRDWAAMHTEACEATRLRREQSEEVLDLRMVCLSQRLQELKAATELFAAADGRVVEKAVQVVSGLSPLAGCADVAALEAPVRLPRDAAAKARVEEARGLIARAKALQQGGRYPEGLETAAQALARARAAAYPPVEAEALLQLGRLQMLARQDEASASSLEEAFCVSEACRHDEVATRSAIYLMTATGENLSRRDDGHFWARTAEALVRRGGDIAGEGLLNEHVGSLAVAEGRYDEALARLQRAREQLSKALGPDHEEVATTLSNIGAVLDMLSRYDEALAAHRRALQIREQTLGPEHPDAAASHSDIARVLESEGRYDEALAEARTSLAIRERALGPEHPDVAMSHIHIGNALDLEGDFESSLAEYRLALAIESKALGPDHPEVADCHNNVSIELDKLGKPEEALAEGRIALASREKTLGPEHPEVASSHNNIGVFLTEQGRWAEAQVELQRALSIRVQVFGPDHITVADTHGNLGDLRCAQDRIAEALVEYRRALAIREKALGPDHTGVARARDSVGDALHRLGKPEEALVELRRSLAVKEKEMGADNPETAVTLGFIGETELDLRLFDQSRDHLGRALAIIEAKAPMPNMLGDLRFSLARALWDDRKSHARSLELARQARADWAKLPLRTKELSEIDAWIATHAKGR